MQSQGQNVVYHWSAGGIRRLPFGADLFLYWTRIHRPLFPSFHAPDVKRPLMPEYIVRFAPIATLHEADIEQMLALYESIYVLPDRAIFREDLSGKDEAVLLTRREELVGFTTMKAYRVIHEGLPRRIVYSGDTVVHREHWGQQALALAWIGRIGELHREDPSIPTYWFLVVKGHRTYRYLAAFCTHFHPHWAETDSQLRHLADRLASERFGTAYDPRTGLVCHPASRGHLREEVVEPSVRELARPDVAFFLQRNPGFREGHELVCLFEFSDDAMKPLTRRIFAGQG